MCPVTLDPNGPEVGLSTVSLTLPPSPAGTCPLRFTRFYAAEVVAILACAAQTPGGWVSKLAQPDTGPDVLFRTKRKAHGKTDTDRKSVV